jgi:formylmethanofuran dehydrogenase subunit E
MCGEAYPVRDSAVCLGCQGNAPYEPTISAPSSILVGPPLKMVPVDKAIGKTALHDMTQIVPGESKGPAFKSNQQICAGDMCRLQQMGRRNIYILEDNAVSADWVHENEAATSFAGAMVGEGVTFQGPPREGKLRLSAARDGLLIVDKERLERFNNAPGVMCASQRGFTPVAKGDEVASTRAIPLYLPVADFRSAMAILEEKPLFKVLPLRNAKAGILVTGNEIFEGITEDKFIPIISSKLKDYQGRIVESRIVPDDRKLICKGVKELCAKGIDLLIMTAGLSVDPDDVTRQGLVDAGATDLIYGSPLVPGNMILLGRIGEVQVFGVPACALYFKTTAFDVLLPRLLAGLSVTRQDLAALGHGGLCLQCKTCLFPKCSFGR